MVQALREEVDQASMFEEIVGSSPALRGVLSRVTKVAPTDSTVLITGETGTGKELIARAIHKRSRRSGRGVRQRELCRHSTFFDCLELFGHEKGAFTGALQQRPGRFELAEGGTIFLDEVGELPPETQIALLRVLQEREFERVGRPTYHSRCPKLLLPRAVTWKPPSRTARSRATYSIGCERIPEMPPLRERKQDIPLLLDYFIKRYATKAGKKVTKIDKTTLGMLSYPGRATFESCRT